jgi:hypothetical protein
LTGTVTISEDQNVIRRDLERLAARYVKEEAARAPALAYFLQQDGWRCTSSQSKSLLQLAHLVTDTSVKAAFRKKLATP